MNNEVASLLMELSRKMNHLEISKEMIREAIIIKGIPVPLDTPFREYASKILLISNTLIGEEVEDGKTTWSVSFESNIGIIKDYVDIKNKTVEPPFFEQIGFLTDRCNIISRPYKDDEEIIRSRNINITENFGSLYDKDNMIINDLYIHIKDEIEDLYDSASLKTFYSIEIYEDKKTNTTVEVLDIIPNIRDSIQNVINNVGVHLTDIIEDISADINDSIRTNLKVITIKLQPEYLEDVDDGLQNIISNVGTHLTDILEDITDSNKINYKVINIKLVPEYIGKLEDSQIPDVREFVDLFVNETIEFFDEQKTEAKKITIQKEENNSGIQIIINEILDLSDNLGVTTNQ